MIANFEIYVLNERLHIMSYISHSHLGLGKFLEGVGEALKFRGVVKKRESPDFKSPEVSPKAFHSCFIFYGYLKLFKVTRKGNKSLTSYPALESNS